MDSLLQEDYRIEVPWKDERSHTHLTIGVFQYKRFGSLGRETVSFTYRRIGSKSEEWNSQNGCFEVGRKDKYENIFAWIFFNHL